MNTSRARPKTVPPKPEDPSEYQFRQKRMAHWNRVSPRKENPGRPGAYYHKLLHHYYGFLIPPGLRILELGCGHGDLLAHLMPSVGLGIDLSGEMVRIAAKKYPHLTFIQADAHEIELSTRFDVIILSDLINDLWDVQRVFEKMRNLTHDGTRLVINFYNNLWRIPLSVLKWLGLGAEVLEQNWFSPHDVCNLVELAGFEVIQKRSIILLPLDIPLFSNFFNRYLSHLPPFSWFDLSNMVVARPNPVRDKCNTGKKPSVSVIVPARNEAGNIEDILRRVPELGCRTELIFVEGHSTDNTYETIEKLIEKSDARK